MTEPILTPPAVPRKRRRFLRTAFVLLVLLLALVWFAPAIIARTTLRDKIVGMALKDFNGTVQSGGASMGWLSTVKLHDVTMTEPSGRVAIRSPKLTTSKTLWQLALQRDDLGTFTIDEPDLILSVENGTTNIEDWIANYTKDDGAPPKPERLAFAIEATRGKATLKGTPDTQLQNVAFAFRCPKSRIEPMEIQVEAETPSGGKLATSVQLGTDTGLSFNATTFPLETVTPMLPRFSTGLALGGLLTADLRGIWNVPADKPMKLEFTGSANITEFGLRAPWLKGETLALHSVALLQSEIATHESGRIDVKSLRLLCDVGDASIVGQFDPGFDANQFLKQAGVKASANIDLAKLAALLPKLMRVRDDTVIRRGSIALKLDSETTATGMLWVGDVQTRDIEAARAQQLLTWKTPLKGSFRGRLRDDGMPDFEDVEILSEFVSVKARGQPEAFSTAVRIDLRKLTQQLEQFVDLGGLTMAGEGVIRLNTKPVPNTDTTDVRGSIDFTRLEIRDGPNALLAEPELHVKLDAVGKLQAKSSARLDSGRVSIFTDPVRPELDQLSLTLREPIVDVATLSAGKADVQLTGESKAWKARLGPLVGWPKAWDMAGRGSIAGTVKVSPTQFVGEKLYLSMKDVRFIGAGLNVDESKLEVATTATYDRTTKAIALDNVQFWGINIGVSAPRLDIAHDPKLGYGLAGVVTLHALILEPMQRALQLQKDRSGADVFRGLAKGTATINATAAKVVFDADLRVENFSYGPAVKPTWAEPWITAKGSGTFDFDADTLQLKPTKIARDGFAVDAEGSVAQLTTATDLNVTGNLTYDLAKIEPQLKAYLGKSGQVSGQGTKPFAISGNLEDGGKNLAVRVGDGSKKNLDHLKGNAAVGWKTLKAYGFDVGEAELKANVNQGLVKINRVDASFGSGLVRLEPTLALNPGFYDLTFAKGTVIQKAKLSPAACADAIGFALPAIANVAQAEGTISFELGDNRVPLVAPMKGTMVGTLLIHEAEVSPGPVVAQIASLFSATPLKLKLTNDQRVPIEFKDGRVYHRDFAITVDGYTVKTSGSVGVDGSLALVLEVPLTGKLGAALVPGDARVREALAKQTAKVAITGTLAKPQLDQGAFRKIVAETLRSTAKEYAKDATEDFIKKGLEKFLPKK